MGSVERYLRSLSQGFSDELSHAPLLTAIKDLTPEQAAWTPSRDRKSIWQNVKHIAFWTSYYAERLAGEPRRPAGWYRDIQWEEVVAPTAQAWAEAIQQMINAQNAFHSQVARLTDDQVDKPLRDTEAPIYDFIQTVITHNSYHCGQIMYLRALQALRPLD